MAAGWSLRNEFANFDTDYLLPEPSTILAGCVQTTGFAMPGPSHTVWIQYSPAVCISLQGSSLKMSIYAQFFLSPWCPEGRHRFVGRLHASPEGHERAAGCCSENPTGDPLGESDTPCSWMIL